MPTTAQDMFRLGAAASAQSVAASGISFVSSDVGNIGSGTSIPLDLQTHAANDFAFIYANGDRGSADISITVATGWTELFDFNHNTGRLRRSGAFYKVLTSGSEVNPTVTFGASDIWAASVTVLRGVHTTIPIDNSYASGVGENNLAPTASVITTVTDNCCVLTMCGLTHNEITGIVAPTGYDLSQSVVQNHGNHGLAYLLNSGAAGLKSPGAWLNTGTVSATDYSVHSVALRPA